MPAVGEYRHVVTLEAPGPPAPDGDGGYTEGWIPLDPPTWYCRIQAASARTLERLALESGAVLAQATHVVSGAYHAGVTIRSRVLFNGRVLAVIAVSNRDERDRETHLICAEVIN